jgi:hypothetical protein
MTTRRSFFFPTIGLTLLFAALGPGIGGALFIPVAVVLEAPTGSGAVLHIGAIATAIGHVFVLIPAYLVGIFPAAATGFLYALWDAWAPSRLPRSLAAAAIGGAITYALYLWLASLGAMLTATLPADALDGFNEYLGGEFDTTLQEALVGSGAVAGLVCAFAASLIGLTKGSVVAPQAPAP